MISVNVKAIGAIGVVSARRVAALWLGNGARWIETHFRISMAILLTGLLAGFFLLVFNQAIAILIGKKNFDTVNLLNVLKMALPFPIVGLVLQMLAEDLVC